MVKVIKSNEGDLRLAIDAPREINIVRGEVFENKDKYRTDRIGHDVLVKVIKSNEGDLRSASGPPGEINIVRGEVFENKDKYGTDRSNYK